MKPSIRELVEIVGIVSIVASLVFVGMQLRLEQRIAVAAHFHERSVLFHDGIVALYENDNNITASAKLWESGFTPGWWNDDIENYQKVRGLSTEYIARRSWSAQLTWIRLNNNYYQYEQGFINEETWQTMLGAVKANLSNPVNRAISLTMNTLEPGFQDVIREIIQDIESEM